MYRISFDVPMPLMMAGRFSEARGWIHDGRMLDRNILCVVEEGSCSFAIGGNRIELNPGDAVIIPKDTFYAPHTDGGCRYLYAHFHARIEDVQTAADMEHSYRYSEDIEPGSAVFYLPQSFTMDANARFSLDSMLSEMTRSDPGSKVKMNLAFLEALSRAADKAVGQVNRTLAREIEKYILENLDQQPTLGMLADRFGYTKQYIIRIFKRQFHTTPAAFINDARLAHAIRYLTESDLRIEEVARRCGFEDANYFSRQFKKKYRFTPSDYRRQSAGI